MIENVTIYIKELPPRIGSVRRYVEVLETHSSSTVFPNKMFVVLVWYKEEGAEPLADELLLWTTSRNEAIEFAVGYIRPRPVGILQASYTEADVDKHSPFMSPPL